MTCLRRLFRFIARTSCRARSPTDGVGSIMHSIFESNGKGIKSAWGKQSRGEMEIGDALSHQLPLVCMMCE